MDRTPNLGDRGVRLDRVTIPVAGRGGAAGFRITHVAGREVRGDRVAAVVDVGAQLAPAAEQLIDLRMVFRPSGCTAEGGRMSLTPTVEVADRLATRELRVVDLPLLVGTADSSCDA